MAILNVGVVMDLPSGHRYHRATLAAIEHATGALTLDVDLKVIPSTSLDGLPTLDGLAAVVIGPGSPYRDPEAVLDSVRSARERGVPLVATWGGFQHVLVEHARNLGGVADAAHAEYGAGGTPVVTPLACSLDGDEITIDVTPGSRLSALHATRTLREFTTCNYGLAPEFAYLANAHGLRVSAVEVSDRETNAEVRAIERTDHPFFLGTLYQPQLRSSQEEPHPVFLGLLRAAAGQ